VGRPEGRDGRTERDVKNVEKWRGLVALVGDAVEHGSRAVEKVQLETARRPFVILEHIPPVAVPAKIVHVIHDVSVKAVHGSIRGVTAVVKHAADTVLCELEAREREPEP